MAKYVDFHNYKCLLEDTREVVSETLGEYIEKIYDRFGINVETKLNPTRVFFYDGKCFSSVTAILSKNSLTNIILNVVLGFEDTLPKPTVTMSCEILVIHEHTWLDRVLIDLSSLQYNVTNTKLLRHLKNTISTSMDNFMTHIILDNNKKE